MNTLAKHLQRTGSPIVRIFDKLQSPRLSEQRLNYVYNIEFLEPWES